MSVWKPVHMFSNDTDLCITQKCNGTKGKPTWECFRSRSRCDRGRFLAQVVPWAPCRGRGRWRTSCCHPVTGSWTQPATSSSSVTQLCAVDRNCSCPVTERENDYESTNNIYRLCTTTTTATHLYLTGQVFFLLLSVNLDRHISLYGNYLGLMKQDFTGQVPFPQHMQQCQSTEGKYLAHTIKI